MKISGLRPDEVRAIDEIIQTASPREEVALKLAALMAGDGEMSGARWLVRKLVDRRRRHAAGTP